MPNDEKWITKHEAVEKFGIGARQLERYVADGRLRKRTLTRLPGEKRDPVCVLEEDIIAIKQGLAAPPQSVLATLGRRALMAAPPNSEVATSQLDERRYRLERPKPPMWSTLYEAARYSGLPIEWLKRAAEAGTVHAIDVSSSPARRVWRFHRDGLGEAKAIEHYAVAGE